MSRELVVQLIQKKKTLYQEQHDLALQELSVEEELAYCSPEDDARLEVKLQGNVRNSYLVHLFTVDDSKTAARPGSIFNRQGGSIFNRR